MQSSLAYRVSAAVAFLAVALGAFGAHGLKGVLAQHGTTEIWHTAVLYHLVHAVVLFVLASTTPFRRGPWLLLLAGTVVFSGSLYVLGVTGIRVLGAITPIGGVLFLIGWGCLALCGRGSTCTTASTACAASSDMTAGDR